MLRQVLLLPLNWLFALVWVQVLMLVQLIEPRVRCQWTPMLM